MTLMALLCCTAAAGTIVDITLYSAADGPIVSTSNGNPCIEYGVVEGNPSDGSAYIRWTPNKWHDGRLKIGDHDSVGCLVGTPELYEFEHICVTARGGQNGASCGPPSMVFAGGYPYRVSNALVFDGTRALDEGLFREVCVPVAELQTAEWDLERRHYAGYFRFQKCGSDPQPRYEVQAIKLLAPGSLAARPSMPVPAPPTPAPSTPAPVTPAPVTLTPVPPTPSPSTPAPPTSAPVQDTILYSAADGPIVSTSNGNPCIEYGVVEGNPSDGSAYIRWTPNKWHDGRLKIGDHDSVGCLVGTPELYEFEHICVTARGGQNGASCGPPSMVFAGGYPYRVSNALVFDGTRALDEGLFREVCVPVAELQTAEWDLERRHYAGYFRFQKCGSDPQPRYEVQAIKLLAPGSLAARPSTPVPPTPAPTLPPTQVPESIATHVKYGETWCPVINPSVYVAPGEAWPAGALVDGDCVWLSAGAVVQYSEAVSPSLQCIVVDAGASLVVAPVGTDVALTVGTLLVLPGGVLDVSTAGVGHAHRVVVTFDGVQDRRADPTELLNGLVSLEGRVTITGEMPCAPYAELLATVPAGSIEIRVAGSAPAGCWRAGDELAFPDSHVGYNAGHYDKSRTGYTPPGETEAPGISLVAPTVAAVAVDASGNAVVTLAAPLAHAHLAGTHVGHVSRTVVFRSAPGAAVPAADYGAPDFDVSAGPIRAHAFHTGVGRFDITGARFDNMGRSTTGLINSTKLDGVLAPGVAYPDGTLDAKTVVHQGNNQLGRYALHCHRCRVEAFWEGSVVLGSPRDGITCHDSRCFITRNVVVGAEGTGIFGEESTETGEVGFNFIIGTGKGTGGGDDGRFATRSGVDMAFGGFGAWFRGPLMLVHDNIAEGIYGVAPYAYFVHPKFVQHRPVPDVPGTPAGLIGRTGLSSSVGFQEYGGFVNNRATGSWKVALELSYTTPAAGDDIVNFTSVALGRSGRGLSTTHSGWLRLTGCTFEAVAPTRAGMVGAWRNNGLTTRVDFTNSAIIGYEIAIRMFPGGSTVRNTVFTGATVDYKAWPLPDENIAPVHVVGGGFQTAPAAAEYLVVMGDVVYSTDDPSIPIGVDPSPACALTKVDPVMWPGFTACACGCAEIYCVDCTRLEGAFVVAKPLVE